MMKIEDLVAAVRSRNRARAATIMFQGTSSDAGKSLLATALCRIFKQDGLRVAPFKSQNMSLNAYVTPDGKEIGRAQGMQADACGIAATTDMNPILLKPSRDMMSQVVVHGKPYRDLNARDYREHYLPVAERIVREALARLRAAHDVVVIEGAGSPAEINLKDRDIVNMRLAAWADAPVILVADIDRGGAFASIVGTLALLEPHERDRIVGIIINKFRGDASLLQSGLEWLEARTGKPVLGVVPWLSGLALEDEDSASLDRRILSGGSAMPERSGGKTLDIAVVRLPRIANFTDIDPLLHEQDVRVRYIFSHRHFGSPDAVIVPGSKNTALDLRWLHDCGLASSLHSYAASGGRIVGICGGYQMLGERLLDPDHVESDEEELAGLGLLPIATTFYTAKRTVRVSGLAAPSPAFGHATELPVEGYEIHMGQSVFTGKAHHPFCIRTERESCREAGAMSADGKVWGTYLHGILHNDGLRLAWLNELRKDRGLPIAAQTMSFRDLRERSFDLLAEHFRKHVRMDRIYRMIAKGADDGDS